MTTLRAVLPLQPAPYITGCKDTHVLAEDAKGERYFVPRAWLDEAPPSGDSQ